MCACACELHKARPLAFFICLRARVGVYSLDLVPVAPPLCMCVYSPSFPLLLSSVCARVVVTCTGVVNLHLDVVSSSARSLGTFLLLSVVPLPCLDPCGYMGFVSLLVLFSRRT